MENLADLIKSTLCNVVFISIIYHISDPPGADPGEVKWVNFHPPFSEHLLSFFSYPSNVDLKHLNQALVLLYY